MRKLAFLALSFYISAILTNCHNGHSHAGHDHEHGHVHSEYEEHHDEDEDHDHHHHDHDDDDHDDHDDHDERKNNSEDRKSNVANGHSHTEDFHNDDEEGHKKHEGEVHLNAADIKKISTETAAFSEFSHVIVATGEILPTTKGEASVVAPFSGIVSIASGVTMGGKVNAGQVLFTISTNVGEASDLVEKATIELEAARREYERDLKLSEEMIVSKKELNECKERYEQAKVKHANLASKISSGKATSKSQIAGFVKSINVSDGAFVNAGEQLAVVSQNDKLMLQVKLPQRYHKSASSIKTVKFRTAYAPEVFALDKMDGRQVSQAITTADGGYYIPLLFEFKNINNVMSGTSVECYVVTKEKKNVITVPNCAIAEDQGVAQVFVKKHEDAFKKQFVTLGETDGERTEVLSGLRSGDIVATSDVARLHLASSSNAIPAHTHNH
ncbi:MAG: efflux RND transporter periplasmic adaptor subunit [Paludibacteraceae bacterium]|nr:efflux RND transporter periplasmic adaptor subunit [Paludibacteraceae bacterium]